MRKIALVEIKCNFLNYNCETSIEKFTHKFCFFLFQQDEQRNLKFMMREDFQ